MGASSAGGNHRVRYKCLVTRRLPEAVEVELETFLDVIFNPDDMPLTAEQIIRLVQDADILVPTLGDSIDSALISKLPERLRLIANFGAGVDHIDVSAARARDIIVTNTPGVLTDDTADIAMALILMVARRLPGGMDELQSGRWSGWSPTHHMGWSLKGKKLGIVGMGRIGCALARRASAAHMEIHYYSRSRLDTEMETALGATCHESLQDLLAVADFVSLHCPLNYDTRHLMGKEQLAAMQRHAVLINTARGEIIDEAALADALGRGVIAGAGLDVFEHEPKVHPALAACKNLVLLPHLGSATHESRTAMGRKAIANIRAFLDGKALPDPVVY